MFRFLSERYPLILQPLKEHQRFDLFYLDMNGIIHTCTHPDDTEIAIENLDEMFERIFTFTDSLFRIVAPRKLMFLAVDGVAPRAKMNQQRSRRFRSAKDAERALAETIARGDPIPSGMPFDSNCITPGTDFMYQLSKRFREWIDMKMRTDPFWQQGCNVVFSGSEVPGEGEHKIMDFIREWKDSPDFSPNARHCMYGLDADLMMLGLVTHSPHFTLIREKVRYSRGGTRRAPQITGSESDVDEFQLLEISRLRDMLFLEFRREEEELPGNEVLRRPRSRSRSRSPVPLTPTQMSRAVRESAPHKNERIGNSKIRLEASRVVDDFVFMCMLVGNDFLPHLPHLDIDQGAIELMFRVYRKLLPSWGGYLTDRHRLHPARLESFLKYVSVYEAAYFEQRARIDGIPEYATEKYYATYYWEKFKIDVNAAGFQGKLEYLRQIYMEGLHWVLQYYHNGVSSWNWFYPQFYAVLASDMVNLRNVSVSFQRGKPFEPLTQLMAVLPPESADFLPRPMADLMRNSDSAVADFYPSDFEVDANGKRNSWEAIVIVPFIDEDRLLSAVSKIDNETELTPTEQIRNQFGETAWFYAKDYPSIDYVIPPRRTSDFNTQASATTSRRQWSRSPPPQGASHRSRRQQAPLRTGSNQRYSSRGGRGGGGRGRSGRRSGSRNSRTGEGSDDESEQ